MTYSDDGSIHSLSDHLEIQGTYTCDLDKGKTEDVIHSEAHFHWDIHDSNIATINTWENSILTVVK